MANKNRTLVKLDDTIIEIRDGAKGLEAKRLSPDDEFEVSLLDEGVEKLIENDVHKLANEAYTELQSTFKTNLKQNVLRIVGFDNRWDKWEIDHCNGRQSALTEFMSQKVKTMFHEEFDKLLQPEIAKMVEPLKRQLAAEFKETFTRAVRENIRSSAQAAATTFLTDVMSKQIQKFQKKALAKAELAFLGRQSKPEEPEEEAIDSEE